MDRGTAAIIPTLLIFSFLVFSFPSFADEPFASTIDIPDVDTGATASEPNIDAPTESGDSAIGNFPIAKKETPPSERETSVDVSSGCPADIVPETDASPVEKSGDSPDAPVETILEKTVTEPETLIPVEETHTDTPPSAPDTIPTPMFMMMAVSADESTRDTLLQTIIIREVQIEGEVSNDDFVELYNISDTAVSLKDFELRRKTKGDATAKGSLFHAFSDTDSIAGHGFLLWTNKDGKAYWITSLSDVHSPNKTSPILSADNSLALFDPGGTIVDAVTWGSGHTVPFSETVSDNPGKNKSLVLDMETRLWSISDTPTPTNSKGKTVEAPIIATPAPLPPIGTIVINEFLPSPQQGSLEWIELRNTGAVPVSLAGWILKDASMGAGHTFPADVTIAPDGYLVIDAGISKIALNNTGPESVILLFPDKTIADTFAYDGSEQGASYARTDSGTFIITHTPTPGTINTFDTAGGTSVIPPAGTIRINELFPNPTAKGEGNEWIELYNTGSATVSLSGWKLRSGSGKFIWSDSLATALREIPANGFVVIPRSLSKLTLRNTDGIVTLSAPDDTVSDTVSYDATIEEASYGRSDTGRFRWSKTLTPGEKNIFGTEPGAKKSSIPKRGYVNMSLTFSTDGNKKNMKYSWDFGDGHRSSLDDTSHRYGKIGTYHGSLTVFDGIERSLKPFTVRIGKYPRQDIHFTELCPNPTGTDTGSEWIRIKNDDTKKINLTGWIIATGTDKETLVNHVIITDRSLGPGEEIAVTHDDSKFTLPNRYATIELRRPDGKTVQSVSYRMEKDIVEDAVYMEREESDWVWSIPVTDDPVDTPSEKSAQKEIVLAPYASGMTADPDSDRLSFNEFIVLGTPYAVTLSDTVPRVLGTSTERLKPVAPSSESFPDLMFRFLNGAILDARAE